MSKDLEAFFSECVILHKKTLLCFHKQADVIKRSQQAVQTRIRCFLFGCDLPKSFWRLAITTAVYLHNKIPNRGFQVWFFTGVFFIKRTGL